MGKRSMVEPVGVRYYPSRWNGRDDRKSASAERRPLPDPRVIADLLQATF